MRRLQVGRLIVSVGLPAALVVLCTAAGAQEKPRGAVEHRTPYYRIALAGQGLLVEALDVDSLGQGKVGGNLVGGATLEKARLESREGRAVYRLPQAAEEPAWEFRFAEKSITLIARHVPGRQSPPLVLRFDQTRSHATVLGRMKPHLREVATPCLLHVPDHGTLRVACDIPGQALACDARRNAGRWVQAAFPGADSRHTTVTYTLEVVSLYPRVAGMEGDSRYDGFRRNYLTIFQVNPRLGVLANNSSSDVAALCYHQYSEVARFAPPLADGLTCQDLLRMSLDRFLAGMKTYGQAGYTANYEGADTVFGNYPCNSSDSLPALLIAAANYVLGTEDWRWAKANYAGLKAWAEEMLATDRDGNGLIKYGLSGNSGTWKANWERAQALKTSPLRPANWWDTIGFGHEDAYSNALAYRALVLLGQVAERTGRQEDAMRFRSAARKLKAAYLPAFFNPKTGWLAGWRSADGKLHDYGFLFVNGVAISYGVVDRRQGREIMARLVKEIDRVGYTRFDLGLPGNLLPVRLEDYVDLSHDVGGGKREDNADAFQIYENGGATAAHAFWTIEALFKVGLKDDAQRILRPLLQGFAAGEFQGFGPNGKSKDWKDWQGNCWGYEGLLSDGYMALLAPVTRGELTRGTDWEP
ncbi:MAG: hypothetical protein ABSF26_10980 [Thermoguttaceae bacterium]